MVLPVGYFDCGCTVSSVSLTMDWRIGKMQFGQFCTFIDQEVFHSATKIIVDHQSVSPFRDCGGDWESVPRKIWTNSLPNPLVLPLPHSRRLHKLPYQWSVEFRTYIPVWCGAGCSQFFDLIGLRIMAYSSPWLRMHLTGPIRRPARNLMHK